MSDANTVSQGIAGTLDRASLVDKIAKLQGIRDAMSAADQDVKQLDQALRLSKGMLKLIDNETD